MRLGTAALAAGLSMMVLVACGGGGGDDDDDASGADAAADTVDIGGWYDVQSALGGDCGDPQPIFAPPTYLWVEPFSGIFYVHYCSGLTEAECEGVPFYDFITPIAGGWAAEGGSSFFSAGCTLSWERTSALLEGDELRIHSLRYTVTDEDAAEEDCTLEAAAALTEPCTYQTDVVGTRRP